VKLKANAKINLSLDVLGRRPNGYHDVRMIMQSIDLSDYITIENNTMNTIIIKCDNNEILCDESNLIYKAAKKILENTGYTKGITISLEKNIPIAAGMAGGSTDAAATLIGLNEFLKLGLSTDELKAIGVTLGADIPFCIEGGTCLSEGIGEILSKIDSCPNCYLVIAKPDIGVSTKFVYENLHLDNKVLHPDVDAMIKSIHATDLAGVTNNLGNILETVTLTHYPIISQIKENLMAHGALGALMSGSGPTVFGIFDNYDDAKNALIILHEQIDFKQGFITKPISSGIQIIS